MYVLHDLLGPGVSAYMNRAKFKSTILKYWPTKVLEDGTVVMDLLPYYDSGNFFEDDVGRKKIYPLIGTSFNDLKYDTKKDEGIDYTRYGYIPGTNTVNDTAATNPTLAAAMAEVASRQALGMTIAKKYVARDYSKIHRAWFSLEAHSYDSDYKVTDNDIKEYLTKTTFPVVNPLWIDDGKGTSPDKQGQSEFIFPTDIVEIVTDTVSLRTWGNIENAHMLTDAEVLQLLNTDAVFSFTYDAESLLVALALLDYSSVLFDRVFTIKEKILYANGNARAPVDGSTASNLETTYVILCKLTRKLNASLVSPEATAYFEVIKDKINSLDTLYQTSSVEADRAARALIPSKYLFAGTTQAEIRNAYIKQSTKMQQGVATQLNAILYAVAPPLNSAMYYAPETGLYKEPPRYIRKEGLAALSAKDFYDVVTRRIATGYSTNKKNLSWLENFATNVISAIVVAVTLYYAGPVTAAAVAAALTAAAMILTAVSIALSRAGAAALSYRVGGIAVGIGVVAQYVGIVAFIASIPTLLANMARSMSAGLMAGTQEIISTQIAGFQNMSTMNQILASVNYAGSWAQFFMAQDEARRVKELNDITEENKRLAKELSEYQPGDIDMVASLTQSHTDSMFETTEIDRFYHYVESGWADRSLSVNN